MRKLKYYVAMSVDGFIAHEDGTWDGFVTDGAPVEDYLASLDDFGVVLMGRKTYEVGLAAGVTDPYPKMESYVFSRTMKESPNERVRLVSEDASGVVRRLKEGEGQPIYLCGGSRLAATLFAEKLIDEMILKVNPFLMGSGIPLFAGVVRQTPMELTKSIAYGDGCVWLYYRLLV